MIDRLHDKINVLIPEVLCRMRLLSITGVNLAVETTEKDPLIARRLEVWQYAGIIALAVALVMLVRVLSPRVEHALLFAVFLTVVLIVFFFTG